MSTFRQTGDGDLDITNGKLTVIEGIEESAVRVRNRLYSVRGEWFADLRIGIPYAEVVFIKNPDLDVIRSVYTQAFKTVPGIVSVDNLDLSLDAGTRNLAVSCELRHADGGTITGGSGTPFIVEQY